MPHCPPTRNVIERDRDDIDTITSVYDGPVSLPDRVKIWLTSVNPFLPKFWHKVATSPLTNVGDIRWQIAAEWLEIAQWSQRRAYWKSPSFFGTVPSPTLYDLPFPQIGSQMYSQVQLRDACCHMANVI